MDSIFLSQKLFTWDDCIDALNSMYIFCCDPVFGLIKNKRLVIPSNGKRIKAALKALKRCAPSLDWESKPVEPCRNLARRILTMLIKKSKLT